MADTATAISNAATATGDAAHSLDHLVDKAGEGLAAISHAIASHAPQAWDLAVRGVYATGLANLITAGIAIIPAALLGWVTCKLLQKSIGDKFGHPLQFIAGVLTGFATVILTIAITVTLLAGGNWVSVIDPSAYLAQQLLSKAMGG